MSLDTEYNPYDPGTHPAREAAVADTCPICGGTLVIVTGKFGKFVGCQHYPKCTFRRRVNLCTATFREFGARKRYKYGSTK